MPWLAVAGMGAASLGGAIAGAVNSSSDRQAAQAAAQAALKDIESVNAPPDLAAQIFMQHFQQAGILTPAVEQQINQIPSQLAQYQQNPALRQAQMGALNQLQQRSVAGMSPEDRAAFNQAQNSVQRDTQGKIDQIMQNMQARGQGGSGAELAAELSAASAGQQNLSEQGDRLAGLSSQRALEAAVASGQLGGQISSQDLQTAQAKSAAQDAINRFNTQNAQNVSNQNAAIQNQAQQYNLGQQQNIMNANTQMANNEALRQRQAQQQQWQDQMQQAQAKANANMGYSTFANNQANQTAGQWQNIGNGLSNAIGTGYTWNVLGNALGTNNNNQNATTDPNSQAFTSANISGPTTTWNQGNQTGLQNNYSNQDIQNADQNMYNS